jgi:hypothetical protein
MDRRTAIRALAAVAVSSIAAPAILLMQESTVMDMLCQFAFADYTKDDVPLSSRWLRWATAS